ncbi:MAG: acetylornithine deacetylase [Spirochaetales bacterium]|nr:acetylornithine deacetylase [Spirochaetales bacterium]
MIDRILQRIDETQDELLEFAKQMIAFETPDPPAHNTQEIQRWLGDQLQGIGMKTELIELYPGEPLLVGVKEGKRSKRTLVFNGHVDVAQVNPDENWEFAPFEPHSDERYLYGRGAADMKSGLAAAFWAIKSVADLGIALGQSVMYQSVIGEEAGEHGTKTLLEKGFRGDFAIVPEPSELKVGGQGGVVTMWITIRSPKTFHDGLRSRLIHAGGGIEGASAIEKMVKIVVGMQELERHWAVTKQYPGMAPGANTINPAVIKGGRHPAFIADECALWYTIHYLPNERLEPIKEEIISYVRDLCQADPWLRNHQPVIDFGGTSMFRDKGEIFPASEVQESNPHVGALFETFRATLGREAETGVWPSVSDAGWFAEYGVPVVICGPGMLEEAHAINEKIEISQILDAAKLYAAYLYRFCGEV